MGTKLGGALWRTPARASATGTGSEENARPAGASDTAFLIPAPTPTASRPPLRAIQPQGQPRRAVPTPKKGVGVSAAGKTPMRVGAMTTPLRPTKILGKPKPVLRLGFSTTGASSPQVQRSKVRDSILLWEENSNVQNASSTLQQDDRHAPAKEDRSDEDFMRKSKDTLSLQLELEITKTILVEEMKARAEAEFRTTALGDELKAANLHTLEACRQKEAAEKELNVTRSVLEALECEMSSLINELEELKKNNFQSPVFCKKSDMETLMASRRSVGQERDEVRRQAEIETAEVIISLEKQLSSLQQQLDACNKKELLSKQSLDETNRIEILLDQSIETLVQKEVLEQYFVSLLRRMEEVTCQLVSQQDQSKRFYEGRIKELEIKMQEMDDQDATSPIPWNKEKEIAEERKIYAEEKNKEVKLLERSIEDLDITVRSLQNEVALFKQEAEQQRRQQEKLEVELENVRQQLLAVPSLEDRMVYLPDPTRHPSYIDNEQLGAQEIRRIGRKEAFEKYSEISEGRKTYAEEKNKAIKLLEMSIEDVEITVCSLEEKVKLLEKEAEQHRRQREKLEVELQNVRQQLLAVPSSREAESSLAFESAPLVEQPEKPSEPYSNECMQEADQSDLEMAKTHSSDKDFWSENSEFEHPSASVELEQSGASKQPELFCGRAHSDQPLSVFDSEASVIEVLKENELPPVAPVRPNDPVNYMNAPSDELKRLRSRNHYEGHRTATDRRFWSIEQQDLYNSIYSRAKLSPMKWIDWDYIDSIDEFACVRERCAQLGLEQIMSYRCDWDIELIWQFYSTVHISADKSSMTWMSDGRRITANKRAWEERFGVPGSDHTAIHSQFMLDDDDKRILYTAAECAVGQIRSLSPLATIANKIIRTTIYPRSGNKVHGHNWNLLRHIVEQHQFDIIALIVGEIELLISDPSRTMLPYAPYIMGMIMRALEYDGPRETRHSSYKPRHSGKLKQTENVSRPPAPAVEAHVEADDHNQFEAAGHRPQGEAVQHTNGSSSSQIPAPRSSLTPSLEATTPSLPPAPAAFPEQASMIHAGLRCFSSASCFGAKSF